MANWWEQNLTDAQKFRLQDPQDPSLLSLLSNIPNPVGDVASGLLAVKDVSKGNYGDAALNSLGLLPFIPSMGAVIKSIDKTVIPAKESLSQVADANFLLGIPTGNKTVNIKSLKGMMSSASDDMDRVNALASKISSPTGYIERLIVDNSGNVLEGQHRLNALKKLGITNVPVTVISNMDDAFEAVKKTGLRNENARQIVQNASEMLREAKTLDNVKKQFDIPKEYENAYNLALTNIVKKKSIIK